MCYFWQEVFLSALLFMLINSILHKFNALLVLEERFKLTTFSVVILISCHSIQCQSPSVSLLDNVK